MSNSILHQLNSTLSVVGYDIASDVGFTMLSENDDAIVGALLYLISPDEGHRPRLVVVSNHLDTILVRLRYLIIKEF